jgi:hypothetical protein
MNLRKHLVFGITLLILHGISEIIFRASRGSLLIMFLTLIMLFVITDRLTKKRLQLFVIIIISTILLWPLVTAYRYFRAESDVTAVIIPVKGAFFYVSKSSTSFLNTLIESFINTYNRIIGSDALLMAMTSESHIGSEIFNIPVHKYFTNIVVGLPSWSSTSMAPSLLGWFYLVGGSLMVFIGTFFYVIIVWIIWNVISKSNLYCKPVVQAFFLFWVFVYTSGGLPEKLKVVFLVNVGTIIVCEWIVRRHKIKRNFH